jgi:hypothetical protein
LASRVNHGILYTSEMRESRRRRHRYDTIVEGVGLCRQTRNFAEALNEQTCGIDCAYVPRRACLCVCARALPQVFFRPAAPRTHSFADVLRVSVCVRACVRACVCPCAYRRYTISDQEAVTMSRWLLDREGLFLGSSSALNCCAALRLARELGPGKTIVLLLCDGGQRHVTKFWNDDVVREKGFDPRIPSNDADLVAALLAAAAAATDR